MIKDIINYRGNFKNDLSKPDGTYQKLLDSSKINNLGWYSKIGLYDGLKLVYDDYLKNNLNI